MSRNYGLTKIGLLLTERLSDNEALWIVGPKQYSEYSGYATTLKYVGRHIESANNKSVNVICAIDALRFKRSETDQVQFRPDSLLREIRKAYIGFSAN